MPCHTNDEKYMHRCLELALQGMGRVAPNPMVGSVIVHDNLIIGEGYHRAYGEPHGEPEAVRHVMQKDLLQHACLYVNLEPCTHHGKTPPCTDLILQCRIPRVVIGTPDPNPMVAGSGIKRLRENGVRVTLGILANECNELNKRFFMRHVHKRPWIILKWARSSDGFIDLERPEDAPIGPNWLTSQQARTLVHKWRSEEQAILVGTNTVRKDDPRLNVRDWAGRDPLRVVIDRNLMLDSSYHVFDNSQKTLVFTGKTPPNSHNPRFVKINFDDTAEYQMLEVLYRKNILSIIIEGGAYTLNRFIEKGLWDEARVFTGPAYFRGGVKSPDIKGRRAFRQMINDSLLEVFHNP